MRGKNQEPIGAHLLYAGSIATPKTLGVIAYPGIESSIGESTITYTDDSKTITSVATNRRSFVVSANTNLFVGQCIKLSEVQVAVITAISGTTISVDRVLIATVIATGKVEESVYYSAYRMDKDAKDTDSTVDNWHRHARYFYLELKNGEAEGRQDLVFPNGINDDDYYVDSNITTKPISMLKANTDNVTAIFYYFKPF